MTQELTVGNTSRFLSHFIFADVSNDSQDTSNRLADILRNRFRNDSFMQIACPDNLDGQVFEPSVPGNYLSLNPPACAKTLFIGIGTGGLAAYRIQQEPRYRGVSVFAICPPPGVSSEPGGGPRVTIYGSKYGVYGLPPILQDAKKLNGEIPSQLYALPSLIHGPKLALRCIAYLIGKYLKDEDLSKEILTVSGSDSAIIAEGLE